MTGESVGLPDPYTEADPITGEIHVCVGDFKPGYYGPFPTMQSTDTAAGDDSRNDSETDHKLPTVDIPI